jgi:hypothetical protein
MENENRILEETMPLQLRTRDAIAYNLFVASATAKIIAMPLSIRLQTVRLVGLEHVESVSSIGATLH